MIECEIILRLRPGKKLVKLDSLTFFSIYSRFSLRLMIAGSIALHTITFLAIRTQKFEATPQILHDRDPAVNPRQSRHNKAIASRHSVWQWLILYFFIVVFMLLLWSAKGTSILELVCLNTKKPLCEHDKLNLHLIFQLDK